MARPTRAKKSGKDILERRRLKRQKEAAAKPLRKNQRHATELP